MQNQNLYFDNYTAWFKKEIQLNNTKVIKYTILEWLKFEELAMIKNKRIYNIKRYLNENLNVYY